jgi:hypothetical protein
MMNKLHFTAIENKTAFGGKPLFPEKILRD